MADKNYTGQLDDLHIYDRVLTADQIKAIRTVENGYQDHAIANDGGARAGRQLIRSPHCDRAGIRYDHQRWRSHSNIHRKWPIHRPDRAGRSAHFKSPTLAQHRAHLRSTPPPPHSTAKRIPPLTTSTSSTAAPSPAPVATTWWQPPAQVRRFRRVVPGKTMWSAMLATTACWASRATTTLTGLGIRCAGGRSWKRPADRGRRQRCVPLGNSTTVAPEQSICRLHQRLQFHARKQGRSGFARPAAGRQNHVGTNSGNLSNYMHFEYNGADTVIHLSSNGGFNRGLYPHKKTRPLCCDRST